MDESTTLPHLNSLRSRIEELKEIQAKSEDIISSSEAEKLFHESAFQIEEKVNQILADTSDIGSLSLEDIDIFLDHLKKELSSVKDENAQVENEIEDLSTRYMQDYSELESELEGLSCSLEFLESKVMGREKLHFHFDQSTSDKVEGNPPHPDGGSQFKIMDLSHQIEKKKTTLKALKDLDDKFKRLDALEKIDDAFSGIRVVEFEGNNIRLSLRTYVPSLDIIPSMQSTQDISEVSEQNHELLIELIDGTMEIKNVEIFPSDVYINEIVDATKSLRADFAHILVLEARSSLEWLVRRVQDQIVLSTIRRLVVKRANKSRYSLEYVDKEETIIAHLVGGLDVFIKVPYGWPISSAALCISTLKSSNINSKDTYLGFVSEVVKRANSSEAQSRENISSFVDTIEGIVSQLRTTEVA